MISIITVEYHSKDEMAGFIASLSKVRPLIQEDVQLLTHDNTERNIGLSKAVNRLLSKAKGDPVLFCNPDIIFNETFVAMIEYVRKHPMTGAVPEFVNLDGTRQRFINRRFPTLARIFVSFTFIGALFSRLFPFIRKDYKYLDKESNMPWRIEQPGGSCLLMSKAAIERLVNPERFYEERLPVFWNDVDLAMRADRAGVQFALLPFVKISHALGHSVNKSDREFIAMLSFSSAGMIGFVEKWRISNRSVIRWMIFLDAIFLPIVKTFRLILTRRTASGKTMSERKKGFGDVMKAGVLRFRCTLR